MIGPALPPGWKPPSDEAADRGPSHTATSPPRRSMAIKAAPQPPLSRDPLLPPILLSWKAQAPGIGCGLRNLGNSCYLNSVLQCLAYVPPLGQRCFHHHHIAGCERKAAGYSDCAACILEARLSRCLRGNPESPEAPNRMWNNLHLLSRDLRKGAQEDAHEALRVLVEAANRDALKAVRGWGYKLPPKEKEPLTPITQLFRGEVQSQVKCRSCGHESNTMEPILDLSLEVHGCRSLEHALDQFTEVEILDGDNKYRCDRCKRLVPACKQMTISKSPPCLVVHLKRFDWAGRKLGAVVTYGEQLSLAPFLCPGSRSPSNYSLCGVVVHEGSSRLHGHYHAIVKDSRGRWYDMDDSDVSHTSTAAALSQSAYLLFYCQLPGGRTTAASSSARRPAHLSAMAKGGQAVLGPSGYPSTPPIQPPSSSASKRPLIGPELPPSVCKAARLSDQDSKASARLADAPPPVGIGKATRIDPPPRSVSLGWPAGQLDERPSAAPSRGSVWELGGKKFIVSNDGASGTLREGERRGHHEHEGSDHGKIPPAPAQTMVWHRAGISTKSAGGAAALTARTVAACPSCGEGCSSERAPSSVPSTTTRPTVTASRGPPEQRELREKLRAWCLQGPMASEMAAARSGTLGMSELQKLRQRVQEAVQESPEAVLGREKYSEALLEIEKFPRKPPAAHPQMFDT